MTAAATVLVAGNDYENTAQSESNTTLNSSNIKLLIKIAFIKGSNTIIGRENPWQRVRRPLKNRGNISQLLTLHGPRNNSTLYRWVSGMHRSQGLKVLLCDENDWVASIWFKFHFVAILFNLQNSVWMGKCSNSFRNMHRPRCEWEAGMHPGSVLMIFSWLIWRPNRLWFQRDNWKID